jgi:type IV pilus assembly protein PilV
MQLIFASERKAAMQLTKARKAFGATLIETMVAIIVFTFGMLGIAALMSSAIKYQIGNSARMGVASNISDLAERIRSNVAGSNGFAIRASGTTSFTISSGYSYTATYADQLSATPTYAIDCLTTTCTNSERAQYDLVQWRVSLRNSLPGGAGLIAGDLKNGFDATVMWFDKTAVRGDDSAFTDTLESNRVCLAADDPTSAAARFCCPSAAQAPAGVRCYNAKVIP